MILNKIAYWRTKANDGKGVSQAHLARRVSVSRSFVTKLEKGAAQPGAELMLRMASYFKQPVEAIFQHTSDDKANTVIAPTFSIPVSQFVEHRLAPARLSSGNGDSKGQIVGKSNGEGCGVPVAQ